MNINALQKSNLEIVEFYRKAFDVHYQRTDNEIFSLFDEHMIPSDKILEERIHKINVSYHTRIPIEST